MAKFRQLAILAIFLGYFGSLQKAACFYLKNIHVRNLHILIGFFPRNCHFYILIWRFWRENSNYDWAILVFTLIFDWENGKNLVSCDTIFLIRIWCSTTFCFEIWRNSAKWRFWLFWWLLLAAWFEWSLWYQFSTQNLILYKFNFLSLAKFDNWRSWRFLVARKFKLL